MKSGPDAPITTATPCRTSRPPWRARSRPRSWDLPLCRIASRIFRPFAGGDENELVSDLARVLVVFGLVAVNAFFVVGECAIVVSRRATLRERADAGVAGAGAAHRLMDDPVA